MPYFINSHPDTPGQNDYTQIQLNTALNTATFRYFIAGQPRYALSANITTLFAIHFRRFDLARSQMAWGYVGYYQQGTPRVLPDSEEGRKIVLSYDAKAHIVIPTSPPSLPPGIPNLSLPTPPENISVTVTIKAADDPSRPSNYGWIDFDISHTFPREFEARSAAFAWEETLHYPLFKFNPETVAGFEPAITGYLQYSALYSKTNHEDNEQFNRASGIAIHVEDERGHDKNSWYGRNQENCDLVYVLRNSIHLDGRVFVRPNSYALSGGDDYGYGGNRMIYRLRAFHIPSACKGAPVDRHDVLDIYRRWLHARYDGDTTSVFYDHIPSVKNRPLNAPADEMSPHTVITNYGLDGAIDPPDPPPPPGAPHLSRWLEMHPIGDKPDIPGNQNDSFLTVVNRLRSKFPNPAAVKMEAQAWGIEKAGFYQFICGFPPLTTLLSGRPNKFNQAVAAMADPANPTDGSVILSVTTDPMCVIFNRGRYGGHIRWKGGDWGQIGVHTNWEPFITEPFPAVIRKERLPDGTFRDSACPVSVTKIGDKQFNRIWVVDHIPNIERAPNSPAALRLKGYQMTNAYGELQQRIPVIGSGLYRATQKQLCPVAGNADMYLNGWVKPRLINQGVRIVEFMKHFPVYYFCYRTDHQHIVEHPHVPARPAVPPATGAPYTNVIGYGSWHVRRLQCMFYDVQEAGNVFNDPSQPCSFRLIHEITPLEAIVPYINQCYSSDETFIFLYSHLVTAHYNVTRSWGLHPGYKEERQTPGPLLVRPQYMLHADRDTDPAPPALDSKMTPEEVNDVVRRREPSFRLWRSVCIGYFNQHFKVVEYGIAPRGYPTGSLRPDQPPAPWNPQAPLAPTNPPTYTYNRCVQDVFNLRANIFETGCRAVIGERITIPATWAAEPLDYNDEALAHATRAAQLQMEFKDFFRHGRMLGETRVFTVKDHQPPGEPPKHEQLKDVWAWGNGGNVTRTFNDVTPLVEHIKQDDEYLGDVWHARPLQDFISKAWDKQTFNDIVVHKQIQHRVWEHVDKHGVRSVLYAFGNISNTDLKIVFLYSRGLEGITRANPWRRVVKIFSPLQSPPTPPAADVWIGMDDPGFVIPARSFAAVLVRK